MKTEEDPIEYHVPFLIYKLWREALAGACSGQNTTERRTTVPKKKLRSSGGLQTFAKNAIKESCPYERRALVVIRMEADAIRWNHRGVRIGLKTAVMEVNGVALADIKFVPARPHKKGLRFGGCRRIFVRFDHPRSKDSHVDVDTLSK
jgi:hypothetical protein